MKHDLRDRASALIWRMSWGIERLSYLWAHEGVRSCAVKMTRALMRSWNSGDSALSLCALPLEKQYRIWRTLQERATSADIDPNHDLERGFRRPLVSIVVPGTGVPGLSLEETIQSIARQKYAPLEVILVCEAAVQHAVTMFVDRVGGSVRHLVQVVGIRDGCNKYLARGIEATSGEFVWFLRSGDVLASEALQIVAQELEQRSAADVLYCDEDQTILNGSTIPFFKPSWSPELLLSTNYLSYASIFRRTLVSSVEQCVDESGCYTFYDHILCATEAAKVIVHIPRVLYHSRQGSDVLLSSLDSGGDFSPRKALERALLRRGAKGRADEVCRGNYRIRYQPDQSPLVSILIPTKDRVTLLSQCIASIERLTSYTRYEIIILDNGSVLRDTKNYLDRLARKWRVLPCSGPFNFSAINNYGASEAKGDHLLFLNDDTEVIEKEWLTVMVEQLSRPGVGAVGAKLLYLNGRIQHAGVVLGVGGMAAHAFRHTGNKNWGYHGLAHLTRNCSAVTAACMLVSKETFEKVHGFDERLAVEFNDVDLCLRIQQQGYRIVYTPDAVLYHYENATRRGTRCPEDEALFKQKWGDVIKRGDPYYNPHLTRSREDWSLNI
jgi:GT2 family glycosyltransferase